MTLAEIAFQVMRSKQKNRHNMHLNGRPLMNIVRVIISEKYYLQEQVPMVSVGDRHQETFYFPKQAVDRSRTLFQLNQDIAIA